MAEIYIGDGKGFSCVATETRDCRPRTFLNRDSPCLVCQRYHQCDPYIKQNPCWQFINYEIAQERLSRKHLRPIPVRAIPQAITAQSTFETYKQLHDHKQQVDQEQLEKSQRESDHQHKRKLSWKYDQPSYQEGIKTGRLKLDPQQLYGDFGTWLNDATVITLENQVDGQTIKHLSSKRGNITYATAVKKRVKAIAVGMRILAGLSRPLHPGRDEIMLTRAMLITCTIDQKRFTPQEAWVLQKKALPQFRYELSRLFDPSLAKRKKKLTSSEKSKRRRSKPKFSSLTSKEGCKQNDYPAPHIQYITPTAHPFHKHTSTFWKHPGKVTYRLEKNSALVKAIRALWPYGNIDIEGIVDGKISLDGETSRDSVEYSTKYLTKSISDVAKIDLKHPGVDIKTHAWAKVTRQQTLTISAQLKRTLADAEQLAGRLDIYQQTSQQQIASSWQFVKAESCTLAESIRIQTQKDGPPWWKQVETTYIPRDINGKLSPVAIPLLACGIRLVMFTRA